MSGTPVGSSRVSSGPPRFGYEPALDGLRALSVAAVLLYHGGVSPFSSGFFGVDVFFVISGYLITSLLLDEWRTTGTISLTAFYRRRARRLLPALYVVLLVVSAYALVRLGDDQAASLPGDVLWSLLYVQNWHLVLGGGYFEGESLLRHLWSLAIEEQFYIVWPIAFAALMRRSAANAAALVPKVAGAAAVSVALMWWQFDDFNANAVNDTYLGTHTRAFTLLFGVLLALVWSPGRLRGRAGPGAGAVLDGAGLLAIALLTFAATEYDFQDPFLYPRGFVFVGVLAVVVTAVAVHPRSRVVRAGLSAPVLVEIGRRSYALYLWNWPVVQLTTPGEDISLHGIPLMVLRLALTAGLAELSYRHVETPVRRGALRDLLVRARSGSSGDRRRSIANLLVGAVSLGTAVAIVTLGLVRLDPATVGAGARPGPTTTTADPAAPTTTTLPGRFSLPIRTVIVGDSVANTLFINAPDDIGSDLALTNGSVEGCSISRGRIQSTQGLRRDLGRECEGWQEEWKASVTAADAQVALVTIGAWDVFDVEIDGEVLEFGSRRWDNEFATQLRTGIAALESAGAQVALVEIPCWRPVDGGGLKALPERGDDTRTRHVNDLLRAAAERDPERVFTVTPPVEYCTDDQIARDLGERWDGVHYYLPGAARFFAAVTPQVVAIPPPPAADDTATT